MKSNLKRTLVLGFTLVALVVPVSSAAAEPVVELAACPPGYTGVIVSVDGNTVIVCVKRVPIQTEP